VSLLYRIYCRLCVGHHDKAAVSISSDNSESVLIRDIPAGYELKTYLDIYQLGFELEDANWRSGHD
jgi:hypothetical protein